jgi:hypothetical protein
MDRKDVPQDKGIYDRWHGISYAVDDDGRYVLAHSAGWEAANIANQQAWDLVEQEIAAILDKVRKDELSPLAYHMARSLMDVRMLSRYAGLSRFRVRRHLKPPIFRRLSPPLLERYAKVFNMRVEELKEIPE